MNNYDNWPVDKCPVSLQKNVILTFQAHISLKKIEDET